MTGIKNFAAAVALVVVAGIAQADVRHTSSKFGFSIVMPGQPITQEKTEQSPAGPLKQLFLMHADDGKVKAVAALELPPVLLVTATDAELAKYQMSFINGFASGVKGKVISSTTFSDGGRTGTEVVVEGAGMMWYGRVFIANGRMYAVFTNQTGELTAFYGSFQLVSNQFDGR